MKWESIPFLSAIEGISFIKNSDIYAILKCQLKQYHSANAKTCLISFYPKFTS